MMASEVIDRLKKLMDKNGDCELMVDYKEYSHNINEDDIDGPYANSCGGKGVFYISI